MNQDKIIKDLLREKMLKIDDPTFTEKIVDIHLSRKPVVHVKPFLGFGTLILGMVSVFLSLGLVLLDLTDSNILKNDSTSGVILLSISLVFLTYKLLDELIMKYPVKYRT